MYYTYVQTLLYYMRSFNFYIHNVHKDFSFNEEKNVDNLALSLSIKKKKKNYRFWWEELIYFINLNNVKFHFCLGRNLLERNCNNLSLIKRSSE